QFLLALPCLGARRAPRRQRALMHVMPVTEVFSRAYLHQLNVHSHRVEGCDDVCIRAASAAVLADLCAAERADEVELRSGRGCVRRMVGVQLRGAGRLRAMT